MPSDTPQAFEPRFCAEVPASCCDYAVISHITGKEVCRVWDRDDAEKIARLMNDELTPTDTDTALPAGEVERLTQVVLTEARENGADSPVDYGDAEQIVRALLAASPKPDTDTPVDPGVEGVTLRQVVGPCEQRMWETNRTGGQFRDPHAALTAALAAKPIAGMDAGEVERLQYSAALPLMYLQTSMDKNPTDCAAHLLHLLSRAPGCQIAVGNLDDLSLEGEFNLVEICHHLLEGLSREKASPDKPIK